MVRTLLIALAAGVLAAGANANAQPASTPTTVSGQTNLWRVSKIVGVPVVNGANEKIGEISDLMMDHSGQVSDVVIALGGFPGNSERLITVKMSVLRFPLHVERGTAPADPVNSRWFPERAVLATSKEALLALPEFKY